MPDTVIRIPDFRPTSIVLLAEAGHKLYVEGKLLEGPREANQNVKVVRVPTFEVTATYDIGPYFRAYAVLNWRRDKVYQNSSTGILVIDNRGDSILTRLALPATPYMMAYNSLNDRLYAAGRGVGYIIDCATDSVVKVLNPLDSVAGVSVWDSVGNKVYMGGWGWRTGDRLNVIDCATDSVVRSFATGVLWAKCAVYYPPRRRIYLQGEEAIGHSAVIDCVGDSVMRRHRNFYGLFAPVVVPSEDKVYWHDLTGNYVSDTLQVTDCRAETLLSSVVPPRPPWYYWVIHGMAYAEWSNRLYVTAGGRVGSVEGYWLVSVDCASDTLLGWIPLPSEPVSITANPFDRRIYVVSYADSAIYVYRDEVPAVSEPGLPLRSLSRAGIVLSTNPFARSARVQFTSPVAGPVELRVYSTAGRLVHTETRQAALGGQVGFDLSGEKLGSGVYLLKVATAAGTFGAKTAVLR